MTSLPIPIPARDEEDLLLTATEAAEMMRRSPKTLDKWRMRGAGPSYMKIGHRVFYSSAAIAEWMKGTTRNSTQETAESVALTITRKATNENLNGLLKSRRKGGAKR